MSEKLTSFTLSIADSVVRYRNGEFEKLSDHLLLIDLLSKDSLYKEIKRGETIIIKKDDKKKVSYTLMDKNYIYGPEYHNKFIAFTFDCYESELL